MTIQRSLGYLAAALTLSASSALGFQAADSANQGTIKMTCSVEHTAPSEADRALQSRNFDEANRLYGAALTADPSSGKAMLGLVRTALRSGKIPDALALATKFNTAHPNNPDVLTALGEVRFRRGEVGEAAQAFNSAIHLQPCDAHLQYDIARYLNLSGMYRSAQHELDIAYRLAPDDPEIRRRYQQTHAVPPTPEVQLVLLKARLDSGKLTDEQKEGVETAIKGIETRQKGSCELVTPMAETKLPLQSISNGPPATPQDIYGVGVDVLFNGKRKRLEVDTGASGLLLSRSVAKAAGLLPELEIKTGGIGDNGLTNAFVTHVDDIKIGNMEFKNCRVGVLERNMLEVDGLIGTDVFQDFVVTLDIPGREMRLAPLPKRPDEAPDKPASLQTTDDQTPVSAADRAKDRYIAPEMKDWARAFRAGHLLIFPTMIGNAPVKLFMMDTGASFSMISPAAAREVTHVSGDSGIVVKGISGQVKDVMEAESVTVTFANVRQLTRGMQSFNSSMLTEEAGVELSGIIGFPMLRELVISIDYRDNLVHVVYDPKHGFHAH